MAEEINQEMKELRKAMHDLDKQVSYVWETVHDDHKELADIRIALQQNSKAIELVQATLQELLDQNHRQTNVIASRVDQKIEKVEDRITEKVAQEVPQKAKEGIFEALIKLRPKIVQEQSKRSWNPFRLFRRKKSFALAK